MSDLSKKNAAVVTAFIAGIAFAACAEGVGSEANAATSDECSNWEYKTEPVCDDEPCDAGSWQPMAVYYAGGSQVLLRRCSDG